MSEEYQKEKEAMIHAATEDEKRIIQGIHGKAQADLDAVREQIARESERAKETSLNMAILTITIRNDMP